MREVNLQTDIKCPEPCEDAVSREALRKAMYHRAFETDGDTMWQSGCWVRYRAIEQTVEEQPAIDPERKTGKWNGYNADNPNWLRDDGSPVFLTCSECHGMVMNNSSAHWNFCPNCGSYNGAI